MPEYFNEPVSLDRIITVRKEDPAFVLLNKRLDYTVGSGQGVVRGADGTLAYYANAAGGGERYRGVSGGSITRQAFATTRRINLANRDRIGFNVRERIGSLQSGDRMVWTSATGNTADGSLYALSGLIDTSATATANATPGTTVGIIITSWVYVGEFPPNPAVAATYPGQGAYVQFIRPDTPTSFTGRRVWAERIDTGAGEDVQDIGNPIPVAFATFRVRWDYAMTRLNPDGRLVDIDGQTWDVIGLQERGRKRYLDIECRRLGA